MTNVQLELMPDIDMFQFLEKDMRGGNSYIANRYGEVNNKYMTGYDPPNHPSILRIWTPITYMARLCLNACQQEDSNGWARRR